MKRKRPKLPVTGTCPLCTEEGQVLKESHIIPKLIYRRMRRQDGTDKLSQWFWSTSPDGTGRDEQNEAKQWLLCETCEGRLQKWETITARFLDKPPPPAFCSDPYRQYADFDYSSIKLFFLSYLWRASVSTLPFFCGFELGTHEETIRKMLLTSDPAQETDYGFVLFNLRLNGRDFKEVASPPFSGTKGWCFVLYRHFVFVASEEAERFSQILMPKHGPYRSFDQELKNLPMFKAFV